MTTAARQSVRELEQQIADRLAATTAVQEIVDRARTEADATRAQAEQEAERTAARRTEAILSAADAEAQAVLREGRRRAEAVTAAARAARRQDVASVLATVLPGAGPSSPTDSDRGQ